MTDNQKKILQQLNAIMEPKKQRIDELTKYCEEDPRRIVTKEFLAGYKAEYEQYMELKMSILEEFSK